MIKKLRSKVFWILMLSISIVIVGTIIIFAYSNYTNTINAATSILERFDEFEKVPNEETKVDISGNRFATIDLSNTYSYMVEQNRVTDTLGQGNATLEEYALKAFNQNKQSGIVHNYVYVARAMRDGRTMIILMENESVTNQIQSIYVVSTGLRNTIFNYNIFYSKKSFSNDCKTC